jgi:predicted MFS family arabinose efflux permease
MVVPLFMYEMVADLIFVDYSGNAMEISIGILIMYVVSAIVVNFEKIIIKKNGGPVKSFILASLVYVIILLYLPWVNFKVVVLLGSILAGIYAINQVITSKIINDQTSSENRATTLSTFNMLLSLPYILMATGIGFLADKYTVRGVVFWLGIVMLVGLVVSVGNLWLKMRYKNI